MDIKIIKAPSLGTLRIIERRSNLNFENKKPGAIGLVQGKIIDMIYACDIAEKCAGVEVSDFRGNCPQHFILLVIAGEISEVEEALDKIKNQREVDIKW